MKNKILKTLFTLNLISMFVFGCMLDSESRIPIIIVSINAIWLFLYTIANAPRG